MVSRFCKVCRVSRNFNIFEVYNKKKMRVLCGFCGTVLMESTELNNLVQQAYSDCCD